MTSLRRAAFVHDLGNVMVPCSTMEKEGDLTLDEQQRVQLHPYYTDSILSRVDMLQGLAFDASAHHERQDGSGFYRQLTRDGMSQNQRILVIANHYVDLVQSGERTSEQALREIGAEVGPHFDSECYAGLVAHLEGRPPEPTPHAQRAASSLSDREIEVIQHLATGVRNKDIASALVISEKTVERHLENIYTKLHQVRRQLPNISCRLRRPARVHSGPAQEPALERPVNLTVVA